MSPLADSIRVPSMTAPHRDDDQNRRDWLAQEFERHRGHLRAVGYRMLGSVSEADDAVQEAWLRLDRDDPGGSDDLRGWLTVVVSRICLDTLRRRKVRNEQFAGSWLPEPIIRGADEAKPEVDLRWPTRSGWRCSSSSRRSRRPSGSPSCCTTSSASRSTRSHRWSSGRPSRRASSRAGRADGSGRGAGARADLAVQWQVVDAFLAAARDRRLRGARAGARSERRPPG